MDWEPSPLGDGIPLTREAIEMRHDEPLFAEQAPLPTAKRAEGDWEGREARRRRRGDRSKKKTGRSFAELDKC